MLAVRRTGKDTWKHRAAAGVCVVCILYITLLSRTPSADRTVHLVPLWNPFSEVHWQQVLLNIFMFIPLGYFLAPDFHRIRTCILPAFLLSLAIELAQFFTYRGMLDTEDIISNCCGAAIGFLIQKFIGEKVWKDAVSAAMLAAGLIGCIIVSRT